MLSFFNSLALLVWIRLSQSLSAALAREAKEEINIDIKDSNLEVTHIMHRKTDRENVNIFMTCTEWQGEIANNEPNKCGGVEFFDIDELPDNIVGYIKTAVEMHNSKIIYSELGW